MRRNIRQIVTMVARRLIKAVIGTVDRRMHAATDVTMFAKRRQLLGIASGPDRAVIQR